MNHTQKKYIVTRIDEVKESKLAAIKARYPNELSSNDKRQQIKEGTAKLRQRFSLWQSIEECYEFHSSRTPEQETALAAELADIETRAQRLLDEVMLGDAAGALTALRAFETS